MLARSTATNCATRWKPRWPENQFQKRLPTPSAARSSALNRLGLMSQSAKRIHVRALAVSLVVLVSSLLLTFSAAAQDKSAHKPRTSTAKPLAEVRAVNAEEMQGLLQRDGTRPLLVNYWATWCDPCRDEFPDLVKIDSDYREKGLDFIAITLDDLADIKTAVPKFLQTMNAKMPVY